ncbi:protein containing PilT protein, N-terminal domain, partial [sediment metagenome]
SNMKYLIDTNILIYYFNGSLSLNAKNNILEILKDEFNISVIAKMEFLGFIRFNKKERNEAARFISFAYVLPLSDQVVEKVIELKQATKIKLPDAIIGATAMCHNLKLVTHNVNDFKDIALELYDPLL